MTRQEFQKKHPKLTRSFNNYMNGYEKQLDANTFERFLGVLDEQLNAVFEDLMTYPAGPERARRLHELVEWEVSKESAIVSTCSRGCSACCHMEVEITNYESKILKQILLEGHPADRTTLSSQSLRALQDSAWREGKRNIQNRCVFLSSEGACSIYEHRPVMCRRHSVTSPALNCETPDAAIDVRYFPRIDLFIVAANEDPELRVGPLAKMLQMEIYESLDAVAEHAKS